MRKNIYFIAIIALIVFLLGWIYYLHRVKGVSIDETIPQGAVFYFQASETAKTIEEFKSTKIWQNVSRVDAVGLMRKSSVPEEDIEKFKEFQEQLSGGISPLMLRKFFGKEVALAIYPTRAENLNYADPKSLLEGLNFLIVTRLGKDAEFMEFVARVYSKTGSNVQQTSRQYKKSEIYTITFEGQYPISYVKLDDLLILGVNQEMIRSSIDVMKKEKPSLLEDERYHAIKSRLLNLPRAFMYVNFEYLLQNTRGILTHLPVGPTKDMKPEDKEKIEESFAKMKGFKAFGYSTIPGEVAKDRMLWLFDKSQMDQTVAQAYACKPKENKSIEFVPQDVLGYQWSNCLDASKAWENLKSELSAQASSRSQPPIDPGQMLAGLKTALGIDIEKEVLPVLGDEIGGFLDDVILNGLFPMPKIAFFIKIKDVNAAQNIMNALLENLPIAMSQESYKNTDIRYISLPLGASLQPGYCILEEYLLVASGRDSIQRAIDALRDANASLAKDKDFQAVDFGLTDKNNTVFFLRPGEMLEKIQGLSEWGFNWLNMKSTRMKAYQSGVEKRLADIKEEIQTNQIKLKNIEDLRKVLEAEIQTATAMNEETSLKEDELRRIKEEWEQKKRDIQIAQDKQGDLQKEVDAFLSQAADYTIYRLYLDELVYPVLDGFKVNRAFGSRAFLKENIFEASSFTKIDR